jgi:hypothetical protein
MIDNLITIKTDWRPVVSIPSTKTRLYNERVEGEGEVGIYQIALNKDIVEIGDSIIHPLIGYTGKSKSIHSRTYSIRGGGHNVCKYIRQNNIAPNDVFVRLLLVEPGNETELENKIHSETEKLCGYRFGWKEASAGKDGDEYEIIELYSTLTIVQQYDILKQLKVVHEKAVIEDYWKQAGEQYDRS